MLRKNTGNTPDVKKNLSGEGNAFAEVKIKCNKASEKRNVFNGSLVNALSKQTTRFVF